MQSTAARVGRLVHNPQLISHLATLVPAARHTIAERSGHDVYLDEPALVVEAIRQVVTGVHNPDTWYGLTSCCAK